MDLIELTEAFLAVKQHAFSPNTRRAYRYDLVACARLLPRIPLTEITVAHLRLFLDATTDLASTTWRAARPHCVRVSGGPTSRSCCLPIPPPGWKPSPSASATRAH